MWVAGGNGSYRLAYSYDGINWIAATYSQTEFKMNTCFALAWSGIIWIAGGNSGYYGYSADGINWTNMQNGSNTCYSICWNGSIFIAGCDNGLSIINSSLTPSFSGVSSGVSSFNCKSVTWNGTMWIAVGNGQVSSINTSMLFSYDGLIWATAKCQS